MNTPSCRSSFASTAVQTLARIVPILMATVLGSCATTYEAPDAGTYEVTDSFSFHCDAPAGRYIDRTSEAAGAVTVTGFIRLIQRREHEAWAPTVSVLVEGEEERKRTGLQLSVHPQAPTTLRVMALLPASRPDRSPMRSVFVLLPTTDAPVPFELAFDASGRLSVKYQSSSYSVEVPGVHAERVVLSCATGEFEFTDVEVSSGRHAQEPLPSPSGK